MIQNYMNKCYLWDKTWILPWDSFWSVWNHFLDANVFTYKHVFSKNGLFPGTLSKRGSAFDPENDNVGLSEEERKCIYILLEDDMHTPLFRSFFPFDPHWSFNNDEAIQSRVLKYCPECASKGYHSIFHQMKGVTKCFIHDIALVEDKTIPYKIPRTLTHAYGLPYDEESGERKIPFPDIWGYEKNIPYFKKVIPELKHLNQYRVVDIIYPWNNPTEHQRTSEKLKAFILGDIEPVCIYQAVNNSDDAKSVEMEFFTFYRDHLDKYYDDFCANCEDYSFYNYNKDESFYKRIFEDMYDYIAGEECIPRYLKFIDVRYNVYSICRLLLYAKSQHIFNGFSELDEKYIINAMHPMDVFFPDGNYEFSYDSSVYTRKYLEVQFLEKLSGLHFTSCGCLYYCRLRSIPYKYETIPEEERIPYVGDADISSLRFSGCLKHISSARYIDEYELLRAHLCFDQIVYMEQQLESMLLTKEYVNPEDFDWNDLDVPLYLSCKMQDGSYRLFRI